MNTVAWSRRIADGGVPCGTGRRVESGGPYYHRTSAAPTATYGHTRGKTVAERVTIKDVARESGVSIKTVSNVLNHTGSMRPETRQRVQAAMKTLGYRLNTSARSLKTGATRLIGLGIFDFSQPFAPYLADKVIDAARRRGYGVITCTYGFDGEGLPSIIDETYRLGADGWLFFAVRPLEAAILDQSYPIVLAGDYWAHDKVDWVTMPNEQAMHDVTARLIETGARRIALVGAPMDMRNLRRIMAAKEGTAELRMQGYLRALEEAGLPIDWNVVVPCDLINREGGATAASWLMHGMEMPDTILCLTDAAAFGAMAELQRHGIRVPQDVQVIGFDAVPEGEYATPSLTSIDPQVAQYAEKAVDMLIERIEGFEGPARTYVSDFSLVERASTQL